MSDEKKVSRSTAWWRKNKDRLKEVEDKRKRTLPGKLANLITTSRYRCKLIGREHDIDVAYLRAIYEDQEGLCAISGIPMIIRGEKYAANAPYSISLDRIDPSLGYIKGNVWLVCTGINLMKSQLSMDQFIEFCRKTTERFS